MFQGNTLAYKLKNGNLDFCQGSPHPTKHSLLQRGEGGGSDANLFYYYDIFNLIDVNVVTGLVL